jgi:hypothetical protein
VLPRLAMIVAPEQASRLDAGKEGAV